MRRRHHARRERLAERGEEIARRREALRRTHAHRAARDAVERAREIRTHGADPARARRVRRGCDERRDGVAFDRGRERDRLFDAQTEREDVGRRTDRAVCRVPLLGRGVTWGEPGGAGDREIRRAVRHPEVEDLRRHRRPGADHHDVRRLEIAMHDPARVRERERVDDRLEDRAELVRRERRRLVAAAAVDLLGERRPGDELEDDVRRGAEPRRHVAGVVHAHDARMREAEEELRFAEERRCRERRRARRARFDQLDRDGLPEEQLRACVDDAEAALAEHALDAVLLRDRRAEQPERVVHSEQSRTRNRNRNRCRASCAVRRVRG